MSQVPSYGLQLTPGTHAPTCTVGGCSIYDPPGRLTFSNTYVCHGGMSRPGVGRFVMNYKDAAPLMNQKSVDVVFSVDGTTITTVAMQPASLRAFTTDYTQASLPAKGKTENSINSVLPFGLVEITLFDMRATYIKPVTQAINVQSAGFTLNSNNQPNYYNSTTSSGTAYTWTQAWSQLGLTDVDTSEVTWPTINPRNLIFDGVPQNKVVDEIASRLGLFVGWDPSSGSFESGNGGYLVPPKDMKDQDFYNNKAYSNNSDVWNSAIGAVIGGSAGYNGNYRLPQSIDFTFRCLNLDNSSDPFYNRTYVSNQPTIFTGPKIPWSVGDYIAVQKNGSTVNQSELDTLAQYLITNIQNRMSQPLKTLKFAGYWPFVIDGSVRGIMWHFGQTGVTTTLLFDDSACFTENDNMQRSLDAATNVRLIGLGNLNVAQTTSASKMIWHGLSSNDFKVIVKQNGGSAGSATQTIDATYDLYALSDTSFANKLNTNGALSPAFNRAALSPPNTPIAVATNGSVATAYNDANGNIALWDCLETPTWVTC